MAEAETIATEFPFIVGHVLSNTDNKQRLLVSEKIMRCFRGEAGERAARIGKTEESEEKPRVEVGIVGGPGMTLRVYDMKNFREAVAKLTRQLNDPTSDEEEVEARRALDVSGLHLVDTENRVRLTEQQIKRLGLDHKKANSVWMLGRGDHAELVSEDQLKQREDISMTASKARELKRMAGAGQPAPTTTGGPQDMMALFAKFLAAQGAA